MKIAVLEDSSTIAEMLRHGLSMAGHEVSTFNDPKGFVIEVCAARPRFDVLICDLDLGEEMSGADAILQVRVCIPGMPAILMSGSSPNEVLAYTSKLPGVPIVPKPFSFKILRELLDTVTLPETGKIRAVRRIG